MDYSNGTTELTSSTIATNTWYHVLCIKKDSTFSIYINGVLQESKTNNTILNSNEFASSLTIGIRPGNLNYPINGSIDDLRIYNRALEDSEIQTLYNLGK